VTWTKLDDGFYDHPKVEAVGNEAAGAYVRMLSYCGRQLTDGHVPDGKARYITRPKILERLAEHGFIERNGTGWVIPDYLEFNPSRDQVEEARGNGQRRNALSRDRDLVAAIRKRDGDECRYCGRVVDWTDRRGSAGGTYDHIDPKGPNSLQNVVVACRGCNSGKGSRTPEQARMKLIPAKSEPGRS